MGETTALVIDEAQSISSEILEEIRLLANIETPTEKLLPLVLAGQPELAQRLEDPNLRQLKQRVALRCEIRPFDLSETATYIMARIRTAGGEPSRLFTRQAVAVIHEHSRGIPRTVSVMCDNALVTGFAMGRQPVDRAILLEVSKDFRLGDPAGETSTVEPIANRMRSDGATEIRSVPIESAREAAGGEGQLSAIKKRIAMFGTKRR